MVLTKSTSHQSLWAVHELANKETPSIWYQHRNGRENDFAPADGVSEGSVPASEWWNVGCGNDGDWGQSGPGASGERQWWSSFQKLLLQLNQTLSASPALSAHQNLNGSFLPSRFFMGSLESVLTERDQDNQAGPVGHVWRYSLILLACCNANVRYVSSYLTSHHMP